MTQSSSVTPFTQGTVSLSDVPVTVVIAEKVASSAANLLLTDTSGNAKAYAGTADSEHLADASTDGKVGYIAATVTVTLGDYVYSDAVYYIPISAATITSEDATNKALPVRISTAEPSQASGLKYVGTTQSIYLKIEVQDNKLKQGGSATVTTLTKDIYVSATGLAFSQDEYQVKDASFVLNGAVQKDGSAPSGENIQILDYTAA